MYVEVRYISYIVPNVSAALFPVADLTGVTPAAAAAAGLMFESTLQNRALWPMPLLLTTIVDTYETCF